jgi:hypothetical protein
MAKYAVGRYVCKVTEQALSEAKTGTPQFVLRFRVLGIVTGPDSYDLDDERDQHERSHYRSITDRTIDYFLRDLSTLGFKGNSFSLLSPQTPGFHNFVGQEVEMTCDHEGEREKWSVARQQGDASSGRPEIKSLDSKKVRDLDNLFGKSLKSLSPQSQDKPAGRRVPPPPPQQQTVGDDDIPF